MDKVIFVGKKFTLGFCGCGCKESIKLRKGNRCLRRFKNLHQNRGDNNPTFNGHKSYIDHEGYSHVYHPSHRFADRRGYIREHRLVWEQHNKACLLPWADVHHKNKQRSDNKIENLMAITHSQHTTTLHQKYLGVNYYWYWKQRWNWLFYGRSLGINQFTKFV